MAIVGESAFDYSGESVSLSSGGLILAIGPHLNDGAETGSDSGHVRVFQWSGTEWEQRGSEIDGSFDYINLTYKDIGVYLGICDCCEGAEACA
jgi:hypothetical protein